MNRDDSKKHRKNFAIGLAVIGGFIALASFSSTYSIVTTHGDEGARN
jgi:hypothetical protein